MAICALIALGMAVRGNRRDKLHTNILRDQRRQLADELGIRLLSEPPVGGAVAERTTFDKLAAAQALVRIAQAREGSFLSKAEWRLNTLHTSGTAFMVISVFMPLLTISMYAAD